MKEIIEFVVHEINSNSFYWTLEGYLYNPSLNQGNKENEINIEKIKELSDFSYEAKRISPTL